MIGVGKLRHPRLYLITILFFIGLTIFSFASGRNISTANDVMWASVLPVSLIALIIHRSWPIYYLWVTATLVIVTASLYFSIGSLYMGYLKLYGEWDIHDYLKLVFYNVLFILIELIISYSAWVDRNSK